MLTDRLLGGVEDEEGASIEKDLARLTAKKNQLELTLTTLKKTISAHEIVVRSAYQHRQAISDRDAEYREDNFYLYRTIFHYHAVPLGESTPRFFQETNHFKIDMSALEQGIRERYSVAQRLSENLASDCNPSSAYLIVDTMNASLRRAERLQRFQAVIQSNHIKIMQAVKAYEDTLARLENLIDQSDYNIDLLRQVNRNIENLQAMQDRVAQIESAASSPIFKF